MRQRMTPLRRNRSRSVWRGEKCRQATTAAASIDMKETNVCGTSSASCTAWIPWSLARRKSSARAITCFAPPPACAGRCSHRGACGRFSRVLCWRAFAAGKRSLKVAPWSQCSFGIRRLPSAHGFKSNSALLTPAEPDLAVGQHPGVILSLPFAVGVDLGGGVPSGAAVGEAAEEGVALFIDSE